MPTIRHDPAGPVQIPLRAEQAGDETRASRREEHDREQSLDHRAVSLPRPPGLRFLMQDRLSKTAHASDASNGRPRRPAVPARGRSVILWADLIRSARSYHDRVPLASVPVWERTPPPNPPPPLVAGLGAGGRHRGADVSAVVRTGLPERFFWAPLSSPWRRVPVAPARPFLAVAIAFGVAGAGSARVPATPAELYALAFFLLLP